MLIFNYIKEEKMDKDKTLTAKIKIGVLVEDAEAALTKFKNSFDKTWSSGKPPQSLLKSLEGLKLSLASLQEIADKDFVNSSDLAQANKDYNSITKTVRQLTLEFKTMTLEQKKALMDPADQKAMKDRAAAMKTYRNAIAKSGDVTRQRASLSTQKEAASARVKDKEGLKAGYQRELTDLQSVAPNKSDSAAWVAYNTKVTELKENIKLCNEEITRSKTEISSIDKQLAKLKTPDQAFDDLKNSLKDLGVEGVESAQNLDQIKDILKKLDKEALEKVELSLKDTMAELDKFGKSAGTVKKEIDKGTDSLERQQKALQDQTAFEARIKQFLGMAGAVETFRRALRNAF
jgi:chromosome segregation ATPase